MCRACCDDGYGVLADYPADNQETQQMDAGTVVAATAAAEAAYAGEPALIDQEGGHDTCSRDPCMGRCERSLLGSQFCPPAMMWPGSIRWGCCVHGLSISATPLYRSYISIHVYIYIYNTYIYICMTYMHVYGLKSTCVYTYIYVCEHITTHLHACIYTIYLYMHLCSYIF